ncbi:unnamed protein product [Eruca vesicaria subsp. sativa]|uniref:Phorbol-ester/DAG-type domain-containing protein n=1 Tax=Eruca vesicaria subsp. sativa TaxID=29727 RepID=A0ABC8LRD2_ERUVS|nr:unnamed protein product [Eruca vesicaria subsp. sativa]
METITSTTMYKPSIHKHPLFFSARVVNTYCGSCGRTENIYGGYYCNDPNCSSYFHKKCAEAPLEINHPSHPQHLLLLIKDSSHDPCDFCGEAIFSSGYICSTCEFKVHLSCGMKPSPSDIEHLPCHDHPLAFLKERVKSSCEVCMESIWGPSYLCHECNIYFHMDCVNLPKEVNHHCHPNHPIKLIASEKLLGDAEKTCFSCKKQPRKAVYHCHICNFSICLLCTKSSPPLVIGHKKTHIHPLTLFSKIITFTCDVCGEDGKWGSYVCIQCAFLTHGECIDLPRVININRHNHQISFTHCLGGGYSKCGVCRNSLSKYHGAYSCSVCPKYAAHCRCAVREDVWDGKELEGIPNHDTTPFKVVGDDLIIHFSHEKHPLKLYNNNTLYDKWLKCEACIYPLGSESIYGCEECGFILHEKCANLSMKIKFIFTTAPYSLEVVDGIVDRCILCKVFFDGFKYTVGDGMELFRLDVHCGSISDPFVHDGHSHPLYFYDMWRSTCDACEDFVEGIYALRCDDCKFKLCLYCATLPLKMWHRNDDHPITLHCGVKMSIESWCDICEREVDHCKWFYTCSDCEVTFHTRCLVGDFSRLKPEKLILYRRKRFEVVRNNNNTRPLCSQCASRCKFLVVLKTCDGDNRYICSRSCLFSYIED